MTIDDLLTQLSGLSAKLEPFAPDESSFDLQILLLQLQKQKIAAGFDALADLQSLAAIPVRELGVLMAQVDEAILSDQKRAQFIQIVISLAKTALRAAGVALPAAL